MNKSNAVMENEKEFVEISEDAYKQNSVYRPWTENKAEEPTANLHKHQVNKGVADSNRSAHV